MHNTQDISNHLEINQLIHRYGKALDEKKYDLLKSVFTTDAELVYLLGEQLIKLPMSETDNLFKKFLNKCYWTSHLISNPVLDIRGNAAESRSHVTATHIQVKEDGAQNIWIVSGAYEDELVRISEGWRIKKRVANAPYVEGVFLMEGVREYTTYPSVDESGSNNKIG
jgi:SnoaL-like protein